jgi:lipoprotein-releasing system ATP-binding protein
MNNHLILSCKNVSKRFHDGRIDVAVLEKIDLEIKRGELVAILGVSGSGKSTLMHLLGGLDTPTHGTVHLNGVNMNSLSEAQKGDLRNKNLGFVYQFHHLLAEFNALENVCMPLLIRGEKATQAMSKARDLLNRVGLSHREQHRVGELSGGERQRVAVARALVTNPVCVLADEPTGNLDPKISHQVFQLMLNLNKEFATSFVVVTHDMSLARHMDRILTLENGQLKKVDPEMAWVTDDVTEA